MLASSVYGRQCLTPGSDLGCSGTAKAPRVQIRRSWPKIRCVVTTTLEIMNIDFILSTLPPRLLARATADGSILRIFREW